MVFVLCPLPSLGMTGCRPIHDAHGIVLLFFMAE